jgi:hypothetical protein
MFQLREGERSSDREVTEPRRGGGLHQVVSEPNLGLFADHRQRRKEESWYPLWY